MMTKGATCTEALLINNIIRSKVKGVGLKFQIYTLVTILWADNQLSSHHQQIEMQVLIWIIG